MPQVCLMCPADLNLEINYTKDEGKGQLSGSLSHTVPCSGYSLLCSIYGSAWECGGE